MLILRVLSSFFLPPPGCSSGVNSASSLGRGVRWLLSGPRAASRFESTADWAAPAFCWITSLSRSKITGSVSGRQVEVES